MSWTSETPEQVVREFLCDVMRLRPVITSALGHRWDPLFRAVERESAAMKFSSAPSEAAFSRDPGTGVFTFYTRGFYAYRSAAGRVLAGSGLKRRYIHQLTDATYALHEIYHTEQGLARFQVVQDHKAVPGGLDEIGKVDHQADQMSSSLVAAVLVAKEGMPTREKYLQRLRDISILLNMAAPIAFGLSDDSQHKQKRRLANWMIVARISDALDRGMVAEVEEEVCPLDHGLWMHFQPNTGDIVLWAPEPRHTVLGTTRLKPETLMKALKYREHMDRGELVPLLRMLLGALEIDAASVITRRSTAETPSVS